MISAIIVNRNAMPWVERCLNSLDGVSGEDLEIIVVDNASTDGSDELVATRYTHVSILHMADEVGMAVAKNLGAARSTGDKLLMLDPDTWLETGCLELLKKRLDDDAVLGLVAPRLVGPDGNQVSRGRFGPERHTAGCTLVRRRAFEEVAGFDPAFSLCFEDADLRIRLGRQGWRCDRELSAVADRAKGRARHVAVHAGDHGLLDEEARRRCRQSRLHYSRKHRSLSALGRPLQNLKRRIRLLPVIRWLQIARTGPPESERVLAETIEEIRTLRSQDELSDEESRSLGRVLECLQVELQRTKRAHDES